MNDPSQRLARVNERIRRAAEAAGRSPDGVRLIAVSKKKPAGAIEAAAAIGQKAFGENYLQEALDKQEALRHLALEWHFIGPLQSNKTKPVAECFDWIHTIDRLKIAERLSAQRPAELPPLNCCLQVNLDAEASKAGATPATVLELAAGVAVLPGLRLRGLMTLPPAESDTARQRRPFAALRELLERLRANGTDADTLSMGMSGDLEAAISEGATLVRVGTAIFGER